MAYNLGFKALLDGYRCLLDLKEIVQPTARCAKNPGKYEMRDKMGMTVTNEEKQLFSL